MGKESGSGYFRDLARALSPYNRGCWSNAHDPLTFISAPHAAFGKAHLKCWLTGEAHLLVALCSVYLACVSLREMGLN